MRTSIFSVLLLAMALAGCGSEPEGRVTGTWEGRRFGGDVWTLKLEDSHGRLTGTYEIKWGEEPSEVAGTLTGSSALAINPDFLDLLIEFDVEVAAGTAKCRYNPRLSDEVVLSGETVCVLDGREFQVGHLGMRRQ